MYIFYIHINTYFFQHAYVLNYRCLHFTGYSNTRNLHTHIYTHLYILGTDIYIYIHIHMYMYTHAYILKYPCWRHAGYSYTRRLYIDIHIHTYLHMYMHA